MTCDIDKTVEWTFLAVSVKIASKIQHQPKCNYLNRGPILVSLTDCFGVKDVNDLSGSAMKEKSKQTPYTQNLREIHPIQIC